MKPIYYKLIIALEAITILIQAYLLLKAPVEKALTPQIAYTDFKDELKLGESYLAKSAPRSDSNQFYISEMSKAIESLTGVCTPYSDSLSADYVKVQIDFKGSNLYLDNFNWGLLDYASKPGCFQTTADGLSMTNYIKKTKGQTKFPFEFSLRSVGVVNNKFEFIAKISDKDGKKVLGKFPAKDPSLKGPIPFLKYPIVISDTIKLISDTTKSKTK